MTNSTQPAMSRSGEANPLPGSGKEFGLRTDPFVRLATLLLALLSLPYFLPLLDESQLWYYGSLYLDLPLLVLAEVVLALRFFKTRERNDRFFWGWLFFALSLWIMQSAL